MPRTDGGRISYTKQTELLPRWQPSLFHQQSFFRPENMKTESTVNNKQFDTSSV
jgi:hypothetical protein